MDFFVMITKEKIYSFLQETLVSLFEVPLEDIKPSANLYEDLDIDSIDAVDLTVKLKEFTGRRIQPSDFKQVRTVQDIVDAVYELLNRPATHPTSETTDPSLTTQGQLDGGN
jgi:acyl carrier protein